MRKGMILMIITGMGTEKQNKKSESTNKSKDVFWPGVYKKQEQAQQNQTAQL